MTRFVGLGREADGHRRHVAVVGGAGNEGHEQDVGQHVFEGKADGDHEFERAGGDRVVEERLAVRQIPHAGLLMGELVHPVVVLVVVRDRVDLRLEVTVFIDRLHLAGDARTGAVHLAAHHREATGGHQLKRRRRAKEKLEHVDVAGIGHRQVAVVLVEAIEDGVQLALLLGLVFPVGVHGQAERILPLVPVVNLDAFVRGLRENVFHFLVGRVPGQITGHQAVALFQAELLGNFHIHVVLSLAAGIRNSSSG